MELFVCIGVDSAQRSRLERIAAGDRVHFAEPASLDGPPDARFLASEVALGSVPPDWVAASSALRWLQLDSTGIDAYLRPDIERSGVRISNLRGFFANPVAESCLAGILALYRGIDRLFVLQRRKEWVGPAYRPRLRLLTGRRVVLFGYGAINRRLAELLRPFGCEIVPFASDWTDEALDRALADADIVACVAPETENTRQAFDRRRLSLLKPGAVFANLGRGSLVDEAALVEALSDGRVSGALIDVTLVEPLPADSPLWDAPNVLLTQHTGGGSDSECDRKIDLFEVNLGRYRRGEAPDNPVDLSRGY